MTLYKKIYDTLKKDDILVYPPAVKKGICTYPYVVLEQSKALLNNNHSGKLIFSITILAPVGQYADFLTLIENVRQSISYIAPEIKFLSISDEKIDSDFTAYSTVINFFALKRTNV